MKKNEKSQKIRHWEALEEIGFVTPLSEPPEEFCNWWKNHDHCPQRIIGRGGRKGWSGGITAKKAWMADYQDEFRMRGKQNAAGTGANYAYFGWWRSYPKPRTSNPEILAEHRAWCEAHGKPDPLANELQELPKDIRDVKTFGDIKEIIRTLADKMNMNKAIGWTAADSEAIDDKKDQIPF